MSDLTDRLDAVKSEGRAALIGYLPVGYPTVDKSLVAMRTMIDAGVDIVEIGLPYSDPVLDGPIIQAAAQGALDNGARVSDVFRAAAAVHEAGAPAVAMSYYNPMLQFGLNAFAEQFKAAGGAGVITPDLTPDFGGDWIEAATEHGLDQIFLVAPSSTQERIHMTVKATSGFVYATSLMGVTGERQTVGDVAERLVTDVRTAGAPRVCVGLGVTTGAHAAHVASYADGVIVGSALVRCLTDHEDFEEALAALRAKTMELAAGVRGQA